MHGSSTFTLTLNFIADYVLVEAAFIFFNRIHFDLMKSETILMSRVINMLVCVYVSINWIGTYIFPVIFLLMGKLL